MILKSFLVEKNLSTIENYFVTLFYGENIGLKDDIKLCLFCGSPEYRINIDSFYIRDTYINSFVFELV